MVTYALHNYTLKYIYGLLNACLVIGFKQTWANLKSLLIVRKYQIICSTNLNQSIESQIPFI